VPVVVGVDRDEAALVRDLDDATITGLDAAHHDDAGRRRLHGRTRLGLDVDPGVPAAAPPAKGGRHGALDGPDERAAQLVHLVDTGLHGCRVIDGAATGGRRGHQDNQARGAQPEHRDVTTHADPHGSNSAKRISNEANRPVGGSQRTVTFSTRDRGGPFSSSRTNSWISARGPSARARTRPSLRFATKPESPRPSARRWAKLRYPTPCT